MLKFGLFGAGRIGVLHGRNIARHQGAELAYVADPVSGAAKTLAKETGAQVADTETILADPSIDAVAIALGFALLLVSAVPANARLGGLVVLSVLSCLIGTLGLIPALLSLRKRHDGAVESGKMTESSR